MFTRNRPFRIRLVANANNRRAFRRSARRRMGQGMPLTHQAERANVESLTHSEMPRHVRTILSLLLRADYTPQWQREVAFA